MKNSTEIAKATTNQPIPLFAWSNKLVTEIASEVKGRVLDVGNKFFEIGYLLNLIRHKVFSLEERFLKYENFYDWAEKELGFKRTTVKNLMAINATYSDHSVPETERIYNYVCGETEFSPVIAKKWKGYTQTALVEMLPMSDDVRNTIDKNTPVSVIRQLKKKPEGADYFDKLNSIIGQSTDQCDNIVIDSEVEEVPEPISVPEKEDPTVTLKKLLNLKNVKERGEWLDNYEKNCYLWIDVPALNAQFYRYDFANGEYLIVTKYRSDYTLKNHYCAYQLIGQYSTNYRVAKYWSYSCCSRNEIIDYLTKNKGAI